MVEKSCRENKSILHLNAFCLFAIFEKIRNNCELNDNKDRYRDLINLAISNDYIRSVFLDWRHDYETRIEIEKALLWTSDDVCLNLAEIYESLKAYTKSEKLKFWDSFSTCIKDNTNLRSCYVMYWPESYYSEHMEIFEWIMNILQKKKCLKKLEIHMPTYSAGNLENFRHLQSLKLLTPLKAEALVEYLKSNPNLKEIAFLGTEIYGRLADIAAYGKNIENLYIQMKPDLNAMEYAPLNRLPKLSQLALGGHPQAGTLGELLKSMAGNNSRTLTTLFVEQPIDWGFEEFSKVQHLQFLDCELKVPPSDLSVAHSWQWPVICALDWKMDSKEDEPLHHLSVDILTSKGVLGLISKDVRFVKQMVFRLNNYKNNNSDLSIMRLEINRLREDMEHLRFQDIRDPKDVAQIATFALLKALEYQWPVHARNIQHLARIRDLKELWVKVKLNIERELKQLEEFDIRFNLEDFENEILIDSNTQEIIYLAFVTYLRETLIRSKFANIKNNIALRHLEMEINFDIRP